MTSEEKQVEATLNGEHDLRSYMRIKLAIADMVTSAMNFAREQKDDEGVHLAQKLLARIAEDRFNLVVVGLFNRGKSSLMNAVLGVDRLPVGVLPLTSVVTTVSYGSRERLIIQREGWSIPQEELISAITEYVTESGNPGNHKKVTLAEIQISAEILRRGFHFIDTPGIGSALPQNTAATEEFLSEADAIIFVTSFEFPFTDSERQFFRKVRGCVRKIFLVVNKADLVSEQQRDEILDFLKSCVEKETMDGELKIFAVSARDGLAAKTANQPALIASSGMAELEKSLIEFMTTEKSREFLIGLVDRADRLLQRQRAELRLRRYAHEDPHFAEERLRELGRSIDELLKSLSEIYESVRQKIAIELFKKLRPELDTAINKANAAAVKEITELLSKDGLFHGSSDYKEFERAVNTACALNLRETVLEIQEHLESTVRQLGGKDLQELCESPGRVSEIGNNLLGISSEIPAEDGQESGTLPNWPLAVYEPQLARTAPPFLCLHRIPFLRRVVLRKYLERIAQALLSVENAVLESFAKDADLWLENLMRDVKIRVDTRAQRLRDILQGRTKLGDLGLVDSLALRMMEIRNALEEWGPAPAADESRNAQSSPRPVHLEPCLICAKSLKALYDFFSKNQYDLVSDEQTRLEHAKIAGFCSLHTWHYAKIASWPGICFAYAPMLSRLSRQLEAIRVSQHSASSSKKAVLKLLPDRSSCSACNVVRIVDEATADKLIASLAREGTMALGRSLCLPHLALLLGKAPEEAVEPLLHEQAEMLERTAEDMRSYSLKHNAIRRALLTEEEQSAATRGLIHVGGYAGLAAPWEENR